MAAAQGLQAAAAQGFAQAAAHGFSQAAAAQGLQAVDAAVLAAWTAVGKVATIEKPAIPAAARILGKIEAAIKSLLRSKKFT